MCSLVPLKSPTAVQSKFKNEFGQDPPYTNNIKRWFKNFMETGSILNRKRSGRPSIDEETVNVVYVAFHRSPRKSIRVGTGLGHKSTEPGSTFTVLRFPFVICPFRGADAKSGKVVRKIPRTWHKRASGS